LLLHAHQTYDNINIYLFMLYLVTIQLHIISLSYPDRQTISYCCACLIFVRVVIINKNVL